MRGGPRTRTVLALTVAAAAAFPADSSATQLEYFADATDAQRAADGSVSGAEPDLEH